MVFTWWTSYVLRDKEVVKDRFEERPGDSIRRIDGDEGRGRKVRYRSLFRAGPWYRSYLELCAKQECEEAELEGERERRSGKRYTRCRVGWAKMQGKVSWAKVVTYRLCQTPPISLNDLASKNPTFLGTLLFPLLFQHSPLTRQIFHYSLVSFSFSKYDFDKKISSMKLSIVILSYSFSILSNNSFCEL